MFMDELGVSVVLSTIPDFLLSLSHRPWLLPLRSCPAHHFRFIALRCLHRRMSYHTAVQTRVNPNRRTTDCLAMQVSPVDREGATVAKRVHHRFGQRGSDQVFGSLHFDTCIMRTLALQCPACLTGNASSHHAMHAGPA